MPSTAAALTTEELRALGREVRAARIQKGYGRLDDLADAAGVTRKTLGKLERGIAVEESTMIRIEPLIGWQPNEWLRRAHDAADRQQQSNDRTDTRIEEWRAQEFRRRQLLERITTASRELADAAAELTRLEAGGSRRTDSLHAVDQPAPRAALFPGTPSDRELLDRAQDEAAEAPDAPGTDHGA